MYNVTLRIMYNAGVSFVNAGDSGYPLEPFLLTLILGEGPSPVEQLYNTAHKDARVVVERCFGVLKSRFRCLSRFRALHYSPTKAAQIVNACAVLHNICKLYGLPDPPAEPVENDPPEDYTAQGQQGLQDSTSIRARGVAARQSVMEHLAQHL